MESYIYGLFQIVWYVILCNLFLEIFAKKRVKKIIVRYILWIGLIFGNYLISIFFAKEFFWKQFLIVLLTSVITRFIFQQKYSRILILTLLYHAGCIAIEYVTLVILEKCFPNIIEMILALEIDCSLIGILCQMIIFCLILLMRKYFVRNSSVSLTEIEWIRFSVFPLFTIVVILALILNFGVMKNEQQGNVLIYVACGLLIMNVMIFSLINDIMKREQQISEYRLFQQKMRNKTDTYHSISEGYEKQRKKVHEFTNKMACIMALAQEGEYERLQEYLASMKAEMVEQADCIDTNNVLINAILNAKYQEAKQKGITFVFKINDLSGIKLVDEDVVLLLYNLLNNAFEACEKCEEKIVRLKLLQEKELLILSVANTFENVPVKSGNKFETSKNIDVESHGIGIENIKEVVEKNSGTYVIEYKAPIFKFIIMIPNEKEVLW